MRYVLLATVMLSACSDSAGAHSSALVPTLAELEDVAFPSKKPIRDADGAEWQFKNHKVVRVEQGYILVSEGALLEPTGSHSTAGRLDVVYFGNPKEGLFVKKRFPEAVSVGSWGAISEWAISDKFTDNPVIYASGGFTGQGITEGCSVLTELTKDGPTTVAVIPDYYGGSTYDGGDFETEGMIRAISKTEGFEVLYSGSENGIVRYRWHGSRFATSDDAVLSHCGFE